MIDTDKYEGHTPAEQWKAIDGLGEDPPVDLVAISNANADEYGCSEKQSILAHAWGVHDGSEEKTGKTHDWKAIEGADARLIADAPLLLAEVKRLRDEVRYLTVRAELNRERKKNEKLSR